VPVGQLGVLVDQHAGGSEVARDPGGQLLRQALQLGPDAAIELGAGDVLGQVGAVVLRLVGRPGGLRLGATAERAVLRTRRLAASAALVAGRRATRATA
jgi:hypothetical protein